MSVSMISKLLSSKVFRRSVSSTIPTIRAPSKNILYPYIYTSGRWLHRDEEQRAMRRIDFHFQELCKKILSLCPEASHIISYEKKEGGYNRVLIFLLNNGKRIVARLPTQAAGPSTLTTNSEVATILYVKAHTKIPVPDILDWSDDSTNPIGSEYIIMKNAEGVQLEERWPTMSGSQYTTCVESICETMKQLAALKFPAYGSLYFENAPFDSRLKIPIGKGFCIGPNCSNTYWDHRARRTERKLTVPAGPWRDLADYSSGLIANGCSKLPSSDNNTSRPFYFGSVAEHRELLNSAQSILQSLITQSQIKDSSAPTLLHADLHARNIYVADHDPTLITCLLDWQSSSIEPAFMYANDVPDFATFPNSCTLKKSPASTSNDEAPLSKEDTKMRQVALYCSQAYEICVQGFIPKLRVARSVNQTLIRPFKYANTTWRISAAALRQEFLDLADEWEELELKGECPYSPSFEELQIHRDEYKAFQQVQDIKKVLIKTLRVGSDGWVPIEHWDETRLAHQKTFELALEMAHGDEEGCKMTEGEGRGGDGEDWMTEGEVRELWPFDGWKF